MMENSALSRLAHAGSAVMLLLLAGCGLSPNSTFYSLAPIQGATHPPAIHTIRVRRPGIPGYLDRPEIVQRFVDYHIAIASTERWGDPLDIMLGRVLAEDIQTRLPGSSVFTQDGAITVDSDATVEIDVRSFDVEKDGHLTLRAEVAVERGAAHTAASTRAVELSVIPKGDSTPALVSSMSDLLGQLADEISAMLAAG